MKYNISKWYISLVSPITKPLNSTHKFFLTRGVVMRRKVIVDESEENIDDYNDKYEEDDEVYKDFIEDDDEE